MQFHYVYRLVSLKDSNRHYTGMTDNLKERLKKHNRGEMVYTAKHLPWQIESAHAFTDKEKASQFEQYLKSHAGREFAKRHF